MQEDTEKLIKVLSKIGYIENKGGPLEYLYYHPDHFDDGKFMDKIGLPCVDTSTLHVYPNNLASSGYKSNVKNILLDILGFEQLKIWGITDHN